MKNTEFQVGDVVQLKSGGPKMTVRGHTSDNVVTSWFAGSKSETGYFPADTLTKLTGEGK